MDPKCADVRREHHGEARRRWHSIEAGRGPERLVLFPAVGDRADSYLALITEVARGLDGRARVAAIDPPGYGLALLDGGGIPTFAELMQWAQQWGEAQDSPTVFAGNSSGGAIAAAAASAASASRGLVLICWPDWRLATPPLQTLVPADSAALDLLMTTAWHDPPALAPHMAELLVARFSSAAFREHVRSFDPEQTRTYYERYAGPLLFIGGQSDGLVPPKAVEDSCAARPGSTAVLLPHCGHFPHKERPDALASALLAFVDPLVRTQRS